MNSSRKDPLDTDTWRSCDMNTLLFSGDVCLIDTGNGVYGEV